MDHNFRDVCSIEAEAQDRLIRRKHALQEQLDHIPLGEFSASDLPALLRVLDSPHQGNPSHKDMERLEQKVTDLAMNP